LSPPYDPGTSPPYGTVDVPVPGGELRVGRWGEPGAPVLALHGVTANHLCWAPVARRLTGPQPADAVGSGRGPAIQLLAPDLRGRGRSGGLPGPYGMAAHAEDAVAVLDACDIERAIVAGHSMGGFAALVLAHRHPDRVARLVLVDGGLPMPLPAGVDPDAALEAVIGPAAHRLATTFPSRAAHLDFWRAHPAMADWNDDIERYVDYDLVGNAPELRSSCSLEAVRGDTVDLVTGTALPGALELLAVPDGPLGRVPWLRAEAGMLGEPPGLYPPDVARGWAERYPALAPQTVEGANHYTILLGPAGADEVARTLTEAASGLA
jgi:pimeloyl-ACP methyl ester carboxylesterase